MDGANAGAGEEKQSRKDGGRKVMEKQRHQTSGRRDKEDTGYEVFFLSLFLLVF